MSTKNGQLGITSTSEHVRLGFEVRDPNLKVVTNKLITEARAVAGSMAQGRDSVPINEFDLHHIANMTASNVNAANEIFQLLPDLELVRQIWISQILSPKDSVSTELNYVIDDSFDMLGDLNGPLLAALREHFEKGYKIKQRLADILSEAMFVGGSYPLAILPESSIDEIINSDNRVSTESLAAVTNSAGLLNQSGFLGKATSAGSGNTAIGLESFMRSADELLPKTATDMQISFEGVGAEGDLGGVFVVDNFDVLKLPHARMKMQKDRVQDLITKRAKLGMESREVKVDAAAAVKSFYRSRDYKRSVVQEVKTTNSLSRATVGHPLVMRLPPESVIPVHVPGAPEQHVGYFVLLDVNGNPLSKASENDFYQEINDLRSSNSEIANQLISKAGMAVNGMERDVNVHTELMTQAYGRLVEKDLKTRLENGIYGKDVEISNYGEIYRIMLARALAKKQTQLLFMPAELMTYFAFEYNKYGVGKSLLEDTKILSSIRVMLMLANTMAGVKNAVGRVGVKIQLDPKDPSPEKTVNFLLHQYIRTRSAAYPLAVSNPSEILEYLNAAAVDVSVSGNAAYPETQFDTEDKTSNKPTLDSTLEDNLKNRHIMAMGLSPEHVDQSMNVDFAASISTSNILLAKRVMMYQDKFTTMLEDFIRKYTLNDGTLMEEFAKIIVDNADKLPKSIRIPPVEQAEARRDYLISLVIDFIHSVNVTLPSPDVIELKNQMDAYDVYVESLDKAIEAYLNSSFLDADAMGDVSNSIDSIVAAIRAYYLRQYMRNNNILPELASLATYEGDEGTAFKLKEHHGSHLEAIGKMLEGFLSESKQRASELSKRLGAVEAAITDTDAGTDGDDSNDGVADVVSDEISADANGDGNDGFDLDDLGDDPTLDDSATEVPETDESDLAEPKE